MTPEVAVVYLLTQAPVIVTTTLIFVVIGMRGYLALIARPYPGRPRTRLEIRLELRYG